MMPSGRTPRVPRRGVSLAMMLVLLLLLQGLGALAVIATIARIRLAGDDRLASEGWLVAASALAEVRVSHQGDFAALADGQRLAYDWTVRADGWRWRADLVRTGALVRLVATAERRGPGGALRASRRVTLLLSRTPSDTVRVLDHRARM